MVIVYDFILQIEQKRSILGNIPLYVLMSLCLCRRSFTGRLVIIMASHMYKYFPKNELKKILTSYHVCTGLQVQLINESGNCLLSIGEMSEFCVEFSKCRPAQDSCQLQHANASIKALDVGETYLFSCHGGLYHIVFPIMTNGTMFGSVLAGPFLMDEPDASMIMELDKKYTIKKESLLKLAETSFYIKIITPAEAQQFSVLLYYLVNNINTSSRETLLLNQGKLSQQSRINEAIQMYKSSGAREFNNYPLDKENLLITKVTTGDTAEAKAILNDLLGYLLLFEKHDLAHMKVRIVELCALLSRAAIERGADINLILEMENKLITSIMESKDIYDICYTFQENIDIFTDSLFFASDKSSRIIRQVAEYISVHYPEPLTLEEVANQVHLNASYLSTLFKKITDLSFREYLNKVRIEEAQRLLLNTDYSIIEISTACGFNDQSYFSKVFKRYTGITPKRFR